MGELDLGSFNLLALPVGVLAVILTFRLMVWAMQSMQSTMSRNDQISAEAFATYRTNAEADQQRLRDRIATLEARVEASHQRERALEERERALELELQQMRLERLEAEARHLKTQKRLLALEARLGIAASDPAAPGIAGSEEHSS